MTRALAASLCAVVLFLAAPSAQQPAPPAGAARAESAGSTVNGTPRKAGRSSAATMCARRRRRPRTGPSSRTGAASSTSAPTRGPRERRREVAAHYDGPRRHGTGRSRRTRGAKSTRRGQIVRLPRPRRRRRPAVRLAERTKCRRRQGLQRRLAGPAIRRRVSSDREAMFRWANGAMPVEAGVAFNRASAVDGRLYDPPRNRAPRARRGHVPGRCPPPRGLAGEAYPMIVPYDQTGWSSAHGTTDCSSTTARC